MLKENQTSVDPNNRKSDEVAPAIENFNDSDDTQVLNTADDAFDEAKPDNSDKVAVEEEVLPPGSTSVLDDGEQPVLNQNDKAL